MQYARSKDGFKIAYEKSGKGKPLIIIGGSLADHHMYIPLASELSQKLTVFNYDRRNRGQSAISVDHTLENELQDLEALISLCSEAPALYGHSAGAALAIRAAAAGITIDKLILSDLPFTPSAKNSKTEAEKFSAEQRRVVDLLHQNDKVGAVKFFLRDAGMNEQALEAFISSENGKQAVANSITLPADYVVLGNGFTPVELLGEIHVPVLIITSNDGLAIAEDVSNHLSNGSLAILRGPAYSVTAVEIAKQIINFIESK